MTSPERQLYVNTQVRIIRVYRHRVHPELDRNAAAILWIKLYASMFQAWWEKNA